MIYYPELYIHELDRKAFAALNKFPKFVKLWETFIENYDEKAMKISLLSSAIRLSENQKTEIYKLLPPICEKLGIDIPELYYIKSEEMNAATGGSKRPYIYVTSELADKLSADQLSSVLAHECGHIACGHYLYHSLAAQIAGEIDRGVRIMFPGIRKYLTPPLIKALMFWKRCSELSADRAAVLCDGGAEKTIDMLLKVHGYDNSINRDEFIKQAIDLKTFSDESNINKMIEEMLMQGRSHPTLAARVYECHSWADSPEFYRILSGEFLTGNKKDTRNSRSSEKTVFSANIVIETKGTVQKRNDIDKELERINEKLNRYTNHADKIDYAFAVFSGIISGAIDSIFIGNTKITSHDIRLSHKQVNNFIQYYAQAKGLKGESLKEAIAALEKNFKVAQDNVWKGAQIGVLPKNHHMADFAHHPTPFGLVCAMLVQFMRVGIFVNKDGEWHFIFVQTTSRDIYQVIIPAVITGALNWLVMISERKYEAEYGEEIPAIVNGLSHLFASAPIITEIAKCADNWFSHLVSDMGGSRDSAGKGMGIPGVFLSLLYEISALPILKDSKLPYLLDRLYENYKVDLRSELAVYKSVGKQMLPVMLNEILVRTGYFFRHLLLEIEKNKSLAELNWNNIIPIGHRTINRMITMASITFTVADTAEAAVHSALESAGNWILFAGRFSLRFNYIGAGKAVISIIKEISSENKETQLIHEKLILTEAKTKDIIMQMEGYKEQLEQMLENYIAEDIEYFIDGFNDIKKGMALENFSLVLQGNVKIQRMFGKQVQFENTKEFDKLMESDVPLVL